METDLGNLAGYLYRFNNERDLSELFLTKAIKNSWQSIIADDWFSFEYQFPNSSAKFVLRHGKDRFMLLSEDHEHVLTFLAICGIENLLERPRINVSSFIKDLVSPINDVAQFRPGRQYRLSTIFAAADNRYGHTLKTMAFWGEDLMNAELVTEVLPKISPYRVTVRHLLNNADIASVGSNGEVNFFSRGIPHFKKVDEFFMFLKKRGYIHWSLPRVGSSENED